MSLSAADRMYKDFGFNSKAHFETVKNINPRSRYRFYDIKWRLKMMSKYKNVSFTLRWDKYSIDSFFSQYEDYVIRGQSGAPINSWPKDAKEQYEYLFERLVRPWIIIKHGRLIFSIKSPNNIIWFRALDLQELFEAMKICFKKSKQENASVKPWDLSLKWNECVTSYRIKRNYGAFWIGKDYDVALLICDNIISTWNKNTGDWKPWNNKWSQKAYQGLTGIKYNKIGVNSKVKNKIEFSDISNWVFSKGLKGMKQAAFIIAVAFTVGGSRAARIINGFHEQHGIAKWWEKR